MAAEPNHTNVPVRVKDAGLNYGADPARLQPGQICTSPNGRRGTHFRDPDGDLLEILTLTKEVQP